MTGRDFDEKDEDGNTSLHLAAAVGDFERVKDFSGRLAAEKLSPLNAISETPLDIAIIYGHDDIAELLKSKGAKTCADLDRKNDLLLKTWLGSEPEGGYTLDHVRQASVEHGFSLFAHFARAGRFDEVLRIAARDKAGRLEVSDLTAPEKNGDTVLTALGKVKKLKEVFKVSLWNNRQGDMKTLWDMTPEPYKDEADFDFESLRSELSAQMMRQTTGASFKFRKP